MVGGHAFHCEPGASEHLLQGLLDTRSLGEQGLAVGGAHIVEVDVHREARDVEEEEVEGCSPLECQPPAHERVSANAVEDLEEQGGLLVSFGLVAAVRGESLQLLP